MQMGKVVQRPSSPSAKLKREDYHRTKHDPHFSKWQVLVGAADWEDYSLGKEGAARYRVHNLPASSGAGIYELGVAVLSRSSAKIDPDKITVVYLGQAENVRARLQRYGRSGAHLGSKCSCGRCDEFGAGCVQKGPGLFEEVFNLGYSIWYRWAAMKDKMSAERTEAQLLDIFDYPWNKGANGPRRPGDVLRKLREISSSTIRFPSISKRLLHFGRGGVGIKIEASKPLSSDVATNPDEKDSKSFLSRFLQFERSQPVLVSENFDSNGDLIHICGLVMNDGNPCRRPPVAGRKRCEEHKGMRIGRSISKSYAEENLNFDPNNTRCDHDHNNGITCGVNLGEGTFCRKPAAVGRKRCEEHKGMKVNSCLSKPKPEETPQKPSINSESETSIDPTIDNASSSNNSSGNSHVSAICGAALENGSFCRRWPNQGNKRCWQHKGKKGVITLPGMDSSLSKYEMCGVTLQDGMVCMIAPVPGRKRCQQHKGIRITYSCN